MIQFQITSKKKKKLVAIILTYPGKMQIRPTKFFSTDSRPATVSGFSTAQPGGGELGDLNLGLNLDLSQHFVKTAS